MNHIMGIWWPPADTTFFWGRFSQVGKYVVVRSSNVPMNVDWLLAVRNKRDDDAAFSSQEENIFPTKTLLCPTRLHNK